MLAFGVCEYVPETVKTAPSRVETALVSIVPSGKITDNFGFDPNVLVCKFTEVISSIVISEVVADFTFPPLLNPDLTGSAISITEPGRTITPLSIDVEKVTVSDSLS